MCDNNKICLQYMKAYSLIHYLAGFYTGENASKVQKIYHMLTDFLIFCILSATVYQLLTNPPDYKESLSVSLVVCIAYSLALYYSLCFRLQYHKICVMFTMIENVTNSLSGSIDETFIMNSVKCDIKFSKIYVVTGTFTSFISAFLFSVQSLLRSASAFGMDGHKLLQIDIWCPYDFRIPVIFEVTVLIQFFTVFWVAIRFFANDLFYMFVIKLNIRFFKLLTTLGANILNDSRSHPQEHRRLSSNKWNLKLLQPIKENSILNFVDEKISFFQNDLLQSNEKFNEKVEEKFKVFIKIHQIILRCARHTCDVYGPVMMMYLLSLICFASVGAFGVIHTNGFGGVQSIGFSFFSIMNLLCMYFMCKTGDELALQSGSVALPMVHSSWYKCSRQFRSNLVILVQQVNTRVQACVSGAPSMPLSCTTFTWVIKTLVSLYLFMVEVQGVKKS